MPTRWTKGDIQAVWQKVSQGEEFKWSVNATPRGRLQVMFPDLDTHFLAKNCAEVNRQLRQIISPRLCRGKVKIRRCLANWVVADWGGIHTNKEHTLEGFIGRLGSFTLNEIDKFVAEQQTKGISSWSKIIAFARPDEYAIYDARTAVALNCCLAMINDRRAFWMPASRNTGMKPAINKLKEQRRTMGLSGGWLGYTEYNKFLQAVVALQIKDGPRSLLDAEMTIFANAPEVARQYLSACAGTEKRPPVQHRSTVVGRC